MLKPGFAADFYFHNFTKRKFLNLAHYFPYEVKLRLLAHSQSFLANQKAKNAIVGAENLLNRGYYMPARGYEFYLRVFNSISQE